jgi:hypothetical protein
MTFSISTRLPRLFAAACTLTTLVSAGACSDAALPLVPVRRNTTTGDPSAPAAAATPAAATLAWNALTRTLVVRNAPNQQATLRAFAYTTLAEHAAIVALDSALVGAADHALGRQALVRIALSNAAATVLRELFPRDASLIDAQLASLLDSWAERTDRDAQAEAIGAAVGKNVVARALGDGFDAQWSGTVPTGYGLWASAFDPARPPLLPRLGAARTFFLARGDQFRPAAPPAPGSPEFQAALQEVRRFSDTRTPEQKRIAEFWAMATGPLAAGYWNGVADSLVARDRLSESRAAHVLALTNMAAWDANVACHDAKYTYWLARPTQMDPRITLAIGLPNHPSYPSNHGCLSGAAAEVLAMHFAADAGALRAQADEAAISRVYAGVHYRFDGEAGLDIGRRVAAFAEQRDATLRGRFPIP